MLSEFRQRLVAEQAEELLLNQLLETLRQQGLLKHYQRQRTDSTHVLAAVRKLNPVTGTFPASWGASVIKES